MSTSRGTILVCDIRNFTSLFDEKEPELAVEFANSVLAVLGKVVEDHNGIVDRFTGDGFLAHFGFTHPLDSHAMHAINACVNLREELVNINSDRYFNVENVITFGLGVHTGVAAYAELKTKQLHQTTILGDAVNLTARIEEMTKYFIVDVLVSDTTYKETSGMFSFRKMPLKSVAGKKKPVQTYWLTPFNSIIQV